jgi:twitching motility protein PilT
MAIENGLRSLIDVMAEKSASDLILTEGQPPIIRVRGDLTPISGAKLQSSDVERFANGLLRPEQREEFARNLEVDSSFGIEGVGRFRLNVFRQQGAVGLVIRLLPEQVQTLEELGVPEIVKRWLLVPHGIVITTGPTGSGKSTSQAAMIRYLNERKPYHVVTIEDPVEYTHRHGTCTIEQRELGRDTHSFAQALKHVFRQSPDVIMIGEMRDRETMETALQLAETGHLVLATLHTGDAMQSISRVIDMFPPDQHQQVRVQLSLTLIGILVQQLVPRLDTYGRILATEVLEATPSVRNLIRKNELQQIYSVLQTSSQEEMITMNGTLSRLFQEGKISLEQAMLFTTRHAELEKMLMRDTHGGTRAVRESVSAATIRSSK